MYNELTISSDIPEARLRKAFRTGTLTLSKDELHGNGATVHLHPESHAKALKAKKAGRGVRLHITKHEVGFPMKRAIGGSIWGKIWNGIKKGFKWAKDNGVLSRIADAAVAPIAAYTGQPALVSAGRQGLKQLTGIGVNNESDNEGEGLREIAQSVKRGAKRVFKVAKDTGVASALIDYAEREAAKKFPAIKDDIHELRKGVKSKFGVGMKNKHSKFAKGSPEAKQHMANLRAMKKGKGFRLH